MDVVRILILDLTCPKPYSKQSLDVEPLGGTEATVIRVAEGLAEAGHSVVVAQHNRTDSEYARASYISIDAVDHHPLAYDRVITLRSAKPIPYIRKSWPDAKAYIWLHDFNQQDLVTDYAAIHGSGVKIIGVSRMHASAIKDTLLSQINELTGVTVSHIYNPIADDLAPGSAQTDNNKFVFFSSPHKGLEHAVQLFKTLRKSLPDATLHIANPGYVSNDSSYDDYVVDHGALPHSKLIDHIRDAFCVLHPNTVFAETFGLVYAEANAIGIPCITHPMGAVAEVLSPAREQLVNCKDQQAVIDLILAWQKYGRPQVSAKEEFRLSNVIQRWKEVLK